MAYTNEVKLRLKKTSLDANSIIADPESKYILDFGEALYISNHIPEAGVQPATGNDYLTFGGQNNRINVDPTSGEPLNVATETIGKHNQFIKAQTKNRVDRALFYNNSINPRSDDRENNVSTQLINDQGINVYPVIIPSKRITNFTINASGTNSWQQDSTNKNIFKYKAELEFQSVTASTKIDLSCKAENLQKMLTNNIYSIHVENENGHAYLYALSFINPGAIVLNLQACLEEVFIDKAEISSITTIIGDGIVASDGNNIEIGANEPANSKAKFWVNSNNSLLYYKNTTDNKWHNITSAFG